MPIEFLYLLSLQLRCIAEIFDIYKEITKIWIQEDLSKPSESSVQNFNSYLSYDQKDNKYIKGDEIFLTREISE